MSLVAFKSVMHLKIREWHFTTIFYQGIHFMLHQENTTFFNNLRCQKHSQTTQTKTIILILLTFT